MRKLYCILSETFSKDSKYIESLQKFRREKKNQLQGLTI